MKLQVLLSIFVIALFFIGCSSNIDTTVNTDKDDTTITTYAEADPKSEITTNVANITTTTTEATTVDTIFSENLKAEKIGNRGISNDDGRSEPNYVDEIGYLAIYIPSTSPEEDYINNSNWTVNTYRQIDADHYEVNGSLPHKTKVKVISQDLKHTGWGNYNGMLTILNLSDNQQYLVSASNFVLNPYWRNNITDAIKDGAVLCQYNNVNKNYLPCDRSHEVVNLQENTKVLAVSKTGVASGLNSEALNITCYYYNQYNEYSELYINEDDLKILY